jgi:4-amino-4-deoxychorismate lyase
VSARLINGRSARSIDSDDRGLQYGDGLFETISCVSGRPRWLALHLERLQRGLARLRIAFDQLAALRCEIEALAGGEERCIIKVIVTRGTATRRGYAPSGDETATRIVSRHPWPEQARSPAQFRVGVAAVCLSGSPILAGLKHLNRLEQVMAQMECADRQLAEVLMLTATRQLISGSMSNVFLVTEEGLITPDLTECGVEGVMRRVVLESAASAGVRVAIRPVWLQELPAVREAFVTNVRLGVQTVDSLDGRALPDAGFAERLRRLIDAHTH